MTPDGQFHDLRPMDLCPSLTNFRKRSESELRDLLRTALDSQIKELEKPDSEKYDPRFERSTLGVNQKLR